MKSRYFIVKKITKAAATAEQEKINNIEIIFRNTCNLLKENVKTLLRKTRTHIPDSLNDGKTSYFL